MVAPPRNNILRCATLLLALLTLGAAPAALAQATVAAYDHPLFTGPRHTAPTPRFDQQHLRLALRFDTAARQIVGDATLRLDPLDTTLDTLSLFAADLTIDSVRIGLAHPDLLTTPFRVGAADSLLIPLDSLSVPGVPFEVRIFYTANPQRGLVFAAPDALPHHPQVWTQQAPGAIRHWIPTLDISGDLLTTELLVTADTSLRVFASGQRVEQLDNEDGTRTTYYRQNRPQALRRTVLVLGGTYVIREDNSAAVPLAYHVFPNQADNAIRTFGQTPAMLDFFADRLNLRFPAQAYTQVVLPRSHQATQMGPGAATFPDDLVLDERAALTEHHDALLAQTAARHWLGTLVTPRYWTDTWLEEGLAAYLGLLFTEHNEGTDAFALALQDQATHYLAEAALYRRPLVWDRWEDPAQLYDAHSISKSAWVLHMLRHRIGDARFWAALENFLADNTGKPIDTAMFERAVAEVMDESFERFFASWVDAAGHPVLDIQYAHDTETGTLAVTVTQQQDGQGVPDVFQTVLTLEAHTLTDTHRFDVTLEANTQVFTLPLEARPRFLVADPDQVLLTEARVEQSARAWVGQLRQATNPAVRRRAARALAAFADDPALLVGLRSALGQEPVAAVRQAIIETIGLIPPTTTSQRLLIATLQDEDALVRAAALNALGAYSAAPEVHEAAFEAAQNDPSYAVQAAAVKTLTRTASPVALDVIRSALITPSHREVTRRAAFEALALLDPFPDDALALGLTYSAPDQPGSVQVAALGYLETHAADTRTALDRLAERLDATDPRVRRAAIEGLSRVATRRALEALREHQAREPEPLLQALLRRALR